MIYVSNIFLILGAGLFLLACVGLFVFRDALSRQHAATKAGSLGLVVLLLGVGMSGAEAGWLVRVALVIAIVWLTMPVASHVLARAALNSREKERDPPIVRAG